MRLWFGVRALRARTSRPSPSDPPASDLDHVRSSYRRRTERPRSQGPHSKPLLSVRPVHWLVHLTTLTPLPRNQAGATQDAGAIRGGDRKLIFVPCADEDLAIPTLNGRVVLRNWKRIRTNQPLGHLQFPPTNPWSKAIPHAIPRMTTVTSSMRVSSTDRVGLELYDSGTTVLGTCQLQLRHVLAYLRLR